MFGLECKGQMQGLMLTATAGHVCQIAFQQGKPLVYVEFLASAPWNLPNVVGEPRYALVGRVLLAAAIQLSLNEEYAGRVGLHALPQADSWYRDNCGMTDLGCDRTKENLRYFEMTPEQASYFLT